MNQTNSLVGHVERAATSPSHSCVCFLPARLGDDHLRADVMEALPEVRALQLHLDLLHGGRGRRLAGRGGQLARGAEGARRPLGQPLAVRAGTRLRVCGGGKNGGEPMRRQR